MQLLIRETFTFLSVYVCIELGQSCKEDQECLHVEGTSCTDNMMCACAAEMILSSNGQNCLPVVSEILEKCTESAQCTTTFQYSSCINNTCQCQEGYHYEHDMTRCFVNRGILCRVFIKAHERVHVTLFIAIHSRYKLLSNYENIKYTQIPINVMAYIIFQKLVKNARIIMSVLRLTIIRKMYR